MHDHRRNSDKVANCILEKMRNRTGTKLNTILVVFEGNSFDLLNANLVTFWQQPRFTPVSLAAWGQRTSAGHRHDQPRSFGWAQAKSAVACLMDRSLKCE